MTDEHVKEFVKTWARHETELSKAKPTVLNELKSEPAMVQFIEGLYASDGRLGKPEDRRKVAYHLALATFHAGLVGG